MSRTRSAGRCTGPLARLTGSGVVRLVLDGVDQLRGVSAKEVQQALLRLVEDPALEHVRLVVSARSAQDWLPEGGSLSVPAPDPSNAVAVSAAPAALAAAT